jgi:nucleoside-diphosphate-sugar epimerase
MVVGNGLLSKVFSSYSSSNDILIFSSGVSDSSETSDFEFNREFELIEMYEKTDMKFVYFSSVTINNNTKYFEHKKRMEDFIKEKFKNYLIFRLPNVVGFGGNDKNMFNYFKRKVKNEEEIFVKDVFRSLVDVDDVKIVCDNLIGLNKKTIEFSYIERTKVIDIVNELSYFLNKKSNIVFCDSIFEDFTKNSKEVDFVIEKLGITSSKYTKKIIEKYGKY